ncbi:MAG: hypothetical protein AABY11_03895 [archaeon]
MSDFTKEIENKIGALLGGAKARMKEAEEMLKNLPNLGAKEKKIIKVYGQEASLSITTTGMIIIEIAYKEQAEFFYKESDEITSKKSDPTG